ncbi:MAG TPA: hypothetical protein VKB68_07335, partial [Stellaceae bacterium]|nr:hypothetical protein [Stellaceae bacterium]
RLLYSEEAALSPYYCIFIGSPGLNESLGLECETDTQAVIAARQMFARRPQHEAFEVWRGRRRVHAELRRVLSNK